VRLTVNGIPVDMNGSTPVKRKDGSSAPFRLLLPSSEFTIDVHALAGTFPIDAESVEIRAQGERLAIEPTREDGNAFHYFVPTDHPLLPRDAVLLIASIADVHGTRGESNALTVSIASRDAAMDPFEREDVWLLDFERDHFAITGEVGSDGAPAVRVLPGANGIADFDEDLRLLGLRSEETGSHASTVEHRGARGTNAIFRGFLIEAILAQLRANFFQAADGTQTRDSVRIRFLVRGEAGAPDPAEFRTDGAFSIMGIGGAEKGGDGQELGRAQIDWNNRHADDDSKDGLGVFTTVAARRILKEPIGQRFLGAFLPGSGTPLGMSNDDAAILAADLDPLRIQASAAESGASTSAASASAVARANTLAVAVGIASVALAALIAHEIGHSLGLVPPGLPPCGLFGGENSASFSVAPTDPAHIDTPGLNIMQPGTNLRFSDLATGLPQFNPLNLAYLRRRLLVSGAPCAKD